MENKSKKIRPFHTRTIYKFRFHAVICVTAILVLLVTLPFSLAYAAPPTDNLISINSGVEFTNSATTTLTLSSTDETYGLSQMQFSCNNSTWTTAESYATSKSFNLTNQSGAGCTSAEGVKYVYVKYKNTNNEWSEPVWDEITLDTSTPDISPLDAGASSSDRTSLTSGTWFNNAAIGGDGLLSYGWTDPASASRNYFYYTENTIASNSLTETGLEGWWPLERNGDFFDAKDANAAARLPGTNFETDSGRPVYSSTVNYGSLFSTGYIPVDTAKSYILSGDFKSAGSTNSTMYYGLAPYDEYHQSISSDRIYRMGSDATISSYTDTQINVAETLSGWNSTGSIDYSRTIGFYYDGNTNKLPDYVMYRLACGTVEYPQFCYDTDAAHGFYSTASGTTISLNVPIPAGVAANIITGTTVIKNHSFSSSYMYSALIGNVVPATWTNYTGTITGEDWGPDPDHFWKGTKYVKLLFLTNYNAGSSKILFDDLNFRQSGHNGAIDFSGSGNDGTLQNGTTYADGKLGQAGSFDGTNDYITATTAGTANSYTYSMWLNPQSSASRRLFFHHGATGSGGTQYMEVLSDNTILNVHGSAPYTSIVTNGTAPDGVWTHYAVTWDGTTMKAYLNGVLDPATQSGSAAYLSGGETFIGQDASLYYKGAMDEVKVYDRALSASEIAREYAKRMSVAPFLDDMAATARTRYMHVKPLTGSLNWGTERIFTTNYENPTGNNNDQYLHLAIGGTGALTLDVPSDFSFGSLTSPSSAYSKDDANFVLNVNDVITVSDLRASGGFNLQLQADSAGFNNGSGNYLPLQNFYVVTTDANTGGSAAYGVEYTGTDISPQNIVAYQDANVNPSGGALQQSGTFTTCGSNLGSGSTFTAAGTAVPVDLMIGGLASDGRQGIFRQNVNFYLSVPGGQPEGSYAATLTYTLIDSDTDPPSQPAACVP